MSSVFGGQINPIPPTSWIDMNYASIGPDSPQGNSQIRYFQGLNNAVYQGQGPEAGPQGLPGYQGALSPNMNQTLLPSVYGAYNPTNPFGSPSMLSQLAFTGNVMGAGANALGNWLGNIQQRGGIGGMPTNMMQNIAATGNTGGANYLSPFLNARPYSSYR